MLIGLALGIASDELWGRFRARLGRSWRRRKSSAFTRSTDAVAHARNLVGIYTAQGLGDSLYSLKTSADTIIVPVLPLRDKRWTGLLSPEDDAPLQIMATERVAFPHDASRIERLRKEGLRLWDGSILYSLNRGRIQDTLPVGVCNYFAYVDLGDRVLRESDTVHGKKPLLRGVLASFNRAISGELQPVVLSAAATCVFESSEGRLVVMQHRSDEVVNARGLIGVCPNFGLELNEVSGTRSRFGVIAYNFMKEFLEELLNQKDARHVAESPRVGNPDIIFESDHGKRLVEEIDSHRLKIYLTGAVIDPSDGSLAFSLLAHFTSIEYTAWLRDAAIGSWESAAQLGTPKLEFRKFCEPEIQNLMSPDHMISSSLYSLDRARELLPELDSDE